MKTKRKLLYVSLMVLVAICLATLTACNIIDSLFITSNDTAEVTSVSIGHTGLTAKAKDTYTITVGKEFTLTAKLNEDAPSDPKYTWYVKVDDGEKKLLDCTTKTFKYTFDEYSESSYQYSLIVDGVESSNTITITMEYTNELQATLTSTTHNIVGNVIQENILNIEDITLVADYNKSALPPETEVAIAWYINEGDTPVATTETYVFTPDAVEQDTIIKLVVSSSEKTITLTVTVSVLTKYDAVDKIELTLDSGADAFGDNVQYKQIRDTVANITISAVAYPLGTTDMSQDVVWTIENKNGTQVLDTNDATATITPAYGENYITASIGNIQSRHMVVFAMNSTDFAKYQEVIETTFVWQNGVYNSFLLNKDDANILICYMVAQRKTADDRDGDGAYLCMTSSVYDLFVQDGEGNYKLNVDLNVLDESGDFHLGGSSSGDSNWLFFKTDSSFNNPTIDYSPASNVDQVENVLVSYSALSASEKRTTLPVDSFEEYPELITNSDMLYRVVGWGYKPKFSYDATGTKMKNIYDAAKRVLKTYITDKMTDVEKVSVIYDWIAQNVNYDYAILNSSLTTVDKLNYNAFSLEGVFLDGDSDGYGQAVCDGRAKAFVLLCGMEGITAVRVRGTAQVKNTSEGHAWNKVLIDANDDGEKEWYMLDTTWSDRGDTSSSPISEILNHQYFLVTDAYVSSTHIPEAESYNPTANTTYNYYQTVSLGTGENEFSLYITNLNEFATALKYSKSTGDYVELEFASSYISSASKFETELIKALSKIGSYSSRLVSTLESGSKYLILINA